MLRRRWWLLALAVLGVWLVAVAVVLVGAAGDVRRGTDAASRARDRLDLTSLTDDPPIADLREAAGRFGDAERATGGVLLAPVRVLPFVGRQLRSVHDLSDAAAEVAGAGAEALVDVERLLDEPVGSGPQRVSWLRDLGGTLERAADRLARVGSLGPDDGLLGPLADARDELATDLADARRTVGDASAGVRAAVALLEGPSDYLLVAANNAEMRAGSGMWLSGGPLRAAAGRLELGEVEPLYESAEVPEDAADTGAVRLEGALGAVWGWAHPEREWRNLMLSPDLPSSAAAAVQMWRAAGRGELDGVLVVDPVALEAIIRVTGPVELGDSTVDADRIREVLLHDQYVQFPDEDRRTGDRREALGELAGAAFRALDGGDVDAPALLRSLADAVRGRHLLAWSADPVQQEGWRAAGMEGRLGPDSMLLSVLNRGANKLDWFLETDAEVRTTPAGDGVDVEVALTLRNETPPGEPTYVAGPNPDLDLTAGTYRGIVTLHVPGYAREVAIDGLPSPEILAADGDSTVVGHQFDLPRGERLALTVRFHLPGPGGTLAVEPGARVPATSWRWGATQWQGDSRRVLRYAHGE